MSHIIVRDHCDMQWNNNDGGSGEVLPHQTQRGQLASERLQGFFLQPDNTLQHDPPGGCHVAEHMWNPRRGTARKTVTYVMVPDLWIAAHICVCQWFNISWFLFLRVSPDSQMSLPKSDLRTACLVARLITCDEWHARIGQSGPLILTLTPKYHKSY